MKAKLERGSARLALAISLVWAVPLPAQEANLRRAERELERRRLSN